MGWASPKKASPCRAASDRKDKLPELEQLNLLNFKKRSYFPRTTEPCMGNLCAEGPARDWLRPHFVSSPLNDLSVLHPEWRPHFVSSSLGNLSVLRPQSHLLPCPGPAQQSE